MSEFILDASAALALMLNEPGADKVEEALAKGALMSAVNEAEVISKIVERDMMAAAKAARAMEDLGIEMVPFDSEQALICGALRWLTRQDGLSLGDRACLALGKIRNLPVVTAERAWKKIEQGALVTVVLIR